MPNRRARDHQHQATRNNSRARDHQHQATRKADHHKGEKASRSETPTTRVTHRSTRSRQRRRRASVRRATEHDAPPDVSEEGVVTRDRAPALRRAAQSGIRGKPGPEVSHHASRKADQGGTRQGPPATEGRVHPLPPTFKGSQGSQANNIPHTNVHTHRRH